MIEVGWRLNLGCGEIRKEGFIGLDKVKTDQVDLLCDLSVSLPFHDSCVEEVYSNHFLEHLESDELRRLLNELVRVCKNDATLTHIMPHWNFEGAMISGHKCVMSPEFFKHLPKWFEPQGSLEVVNTGYTYVPEGLEFCAKLGITPEEGVKFLNNVGHEIIVTMKVVK